MNLSAVTVQAMAWTCAINFSSRYSQGCSKLLIKVWTDAFQKATFLCVIFCNYYFCSSVKIYDLSPQNGTCFIYCCRKTVVCIGDHLLDFSVQELVRSQLTFSTVPKVLQNCTGFTLCPGFVQLGRSDSRRIFCSNGFDTMHVVCTY